MSVGALMAFVLLVFSLWVAPPSKPTTGAGPPCAAAVPAGRGGGAAARGREKTTKAADGAGLRGSAADLPKGERGFHFSAGVVCACVLVCVCVCVCVCLCVLFIRIVRANRSANEKTPACSGEKPLKRIPRRQGPFC